MAVYGLSSTQKLNYVLRDDPCRGPKGEPLEGATVFMLATLDGYVQAFLKDILQRTEIKTVEEGDEGLSLSAKTYSDVFEAAYETCRFGIKGWLNFLDENGKEIPFSTEKYLLGKKNYLVAKRSCIARLTTEQAVELMHAIFEGMNVSKAEEKNSEGQSSPQKSSPSETAVVTTPNEGSGAAMETPQSPS
jgi:hypothetical protein